VPSGGGAPVRVGLLGYGLAGATFHAPLIAATPGLRLAFVVTGNPDRRARAERDHPGVSVLADADALWRHAAELDLVVVATPNRSHVSLALAALEAGLAVVVDKPLAPTASEARRLVEEARRRGLLLTTFQNRRWDGDFLTLRRLLEAGALGRVLRFESRYERWRPVLRGVWRESGAPEDAGGLLCDLFGPVTSVYAELDRRLPGSEIDDDTFVSLTHASGTRSHLWMSVLAAQRGPRLRVLGERAAFTKVGLDVQEEALRSGRRPDSPGWGDEPPERWGQLGVDGALVPVPTEPGAYPRFYAGVLLALRDGAPPPVDPMGSVAVLEVIERCRP
jgi:predicted dehydrogenase